jgi:hypothetical protein
VVYVVGVIPSFDVFLGGWATEFPATKHLSTCREELRHST